MTPVQEHAREYSR